MKAGVTALHDVQGGGCSSRVLKSVSRCLHVCLKVGGLHRHISNISPRMAALRRSNLPNSYLQQHDNFEVGGHRENVFRGQDTATQDEG